MTFGTLLISILISTTSLTITEPVDGETYDGDWLPLRAIVENENELPDSVQYNLNGQTAVLIPRLNTDWPTYMQNYQNHGYSESPAPVDNTILWAAPVTGYEHEFPTPVVYEGLVYYPQNYGGEDLYALNAATGETVWVFEGSGNTDDAVTIQDGYLYTASDSIWCLDALTGTKIWASGLADHSGSTPIIIDNRVFCASSFSYTVFCLDAQNGAMLWSHELCKGMASCMAYWNGMIFVPTVYMGGGVYGSLYALDASTGEVLWEFEDGDIGFWDSSPVVVDGNIYINDWLSKTFAIDALTGQNIWEQSTGGGTATIAYHDERLFFASEGTPYYCLNASNGNTIWTSLYAQHGSSGIADGMLFFGEYSYNDSASVVALDCETGAEVWSYRPSCSTVGFQGSPSITDGVVYYACTDGYLYAFGTGLKYTYHEEYFYADVGFNELIVTSFDEDIAVAADTINFTVTQTGINLEPSHLLCLSASPNPFRSPASISFELSEPGWTSVTVYDLSGRIVSSIENSMLYPGKYSIQWDGNNQNGEPVSSGLYFCRIQSSGISENTGLCLLR